MNNVFNIVNKVDNKFVFQYNPNLIDNVEYVVYALYSSIFLLTNNGPNSRRANCMNLNI
jgi:hypothetical protein